MQRILALVILAALSQGCLSLMPERMATALYRQSIDVTVLRPPTVEQGGTVELWVYNGAVGCLRALLPNQDFRRATRNLSVGQLLRLKAWDLSVLDDRETLVVRRWEARERIDQVAAAYGETVYQQLCGSQEPQEEDEG